MNLEQRVRDLETRVARLQVLSLWDALSEDRRAQVAPEALNRAAEDAPEGLYGDVEALALWAFLSVPL